jgi:unsaturated chondroitin disaccharide hydrolase
MALRLPYAALRTEAEFAAAVADEARRRAAPATVRLLSTRAGAERAPLDSLAPARAKSFREAIDLLRRSTVATAAKWLPTLQQPGNTFTQSSGEGYFMQADPETGEWRGRRGYNWTGSFWVGMLWRLHDQTKDPRFRDWALAWNAPMLGQEGQQNHDTGFVNYYASAFSYDRTKDERYREGALRSAARLKEMFNPTVGLIPTVLHHNDTIIDTMMNLEILWWSAKATGDEGWRTLGHRHAQRARDWLVRPDGSVTQSVHYNAGDKGVTDAASGEWIFKHTHQGFAADTAWSRGTAWALYGFARAYQETGDATFLETAERVAAFVDDHLPEDGVPWYDFHDEGVHYRNRDTSAAAILAAGLLHLADATKDPKRAASYRDRARFITQSLVDRYLTPVGAGDTAPPGYLRHGCGTSPQDGALIFGHYYLLEALQRLDQKR